MRKRLITTVSLLVALAALGVAPASWADPNNATPASPGACNMLHVSDQGMTGMMNDRHVEDIMLPLVAASYGVSDRPGSVTCP
jgi:hypothetical protein